MLQGYCQDKKRGYKEVWKLPICTELRLFITESLEIYKRVYDTEDYNDLLSCTGELIKTLTQNISFWDAEEFYKSGLLNLTVIFLMES